MKKNRFNLEPPTLFFLFFLAFSLTHFTSCSGPDFHDHYFFLCNTKGCTSEFRAIEKACKDRCRRQWVVEKIAEWANEPLLAYLYNYTKPEIPIGFFRISFTNWQPTFPTNAKEMNSLLEIPSLDIQVIKVSPESTKHFSQKERLIWDKLEQDDINKVLQRKYIDYFLMVVFGTILLRFISRFFMNIKKISSDQSGYSILAHDLGIQYLFIILVIVTAPILWGLSLYAIYVLPISIVIFTIQMIIYFISKRNRAFQKSPS